MRCFRAFILEHVVMLHFWTQDQDVYFPVLIVWSWWKSPFSPWVSFCLNICSCRGKLLIFFFFSSPQPLCIQQIFSAHWQEWCIGLSLLFISNVLCINESHICLLPDKYLAAGRNVPTRSLAVKEWCVLGEYCWVNKIVSRHYAGQKGITGVLNGRWVIIDWSICVLK